MVPRPAPDEKLLPHNLEAERALLGAAIIDPSLLDAARAIVAVQDFYRDGHRTIFLALLFLREQKVTIDLVTLKNELERRGEVEAVGGATYISSLVDGVPKSANIEHYGRIIAERARRRDLIHSCERIQEAAFDGHSLEEVSVRIDRANEIWSPSRSLVIPRAIDLYSTNAAMPEFTVSDFIRRSGIHLVWAQPGAGKTYLLLRLCHELLLEGTPSHLFSHPDLTIKSGYMKVLWIGTEEDTPTLHWKADKVLAGLGGARLGGKFLHLWAVDAGHQITLDDLPAILQNEFPLDMVVLDSLTGLRPKTRNGERIRWDADNDATNELCLKLRGLAKTHQIAIVVIHHTGRETSRGYRGPVEWWASTDVQVGLIREDTRLKVIQEKNRDGGIVPPFYLSPIWEPGLFDVSYLSPAPVETLSPSAAKVARFLEERGESSQVEIIEGTGIARSTATAAIQECVRTGRACPTGRKKNRSPIYAGRSTK